MYKHEGLFGSVEVLCGLYLWAKGLVFGVCCLVLACELVGNVFVLNCPSTGFSLCYCCVST